MIGIRKTFPGIIANDDITLQLKQGEIHALLGENGSGKTTLMNILFGLHKAEKGEIFKNGEAVRINDPNDAKKLGIGMVHQHFKLVQNFTVLENIILGAETVKCGILQKSSARKHITELSKQYKLEINPDALVSGISVGMQQRVEILKMLYSWRGFNTPPFRAFSKGIKPKSNTFREQHTSSLQGEVVDRKNGILIFDEPTAALTPQETEELIQIMKNLAAEGKSIFFITHKLDEIKAAADRCTVLRKGKYVGTVNAASVTKEELSEMMIGRKLNFLIDKQERQPGEIILKAENLVVKTKTHNKAVVNDISFEVRSGEIVCIAGIDGNGQQELVYALTGMMNSDSGRIFLEDQEITHNDIRSRRIAHIPEDRHKHGLVLDYNLGFNFVLQKYHTHIFQKNGFLKFNEIKKFADCLIDKFDIRCGNGADTIVRNMSGGNQQKAIVAREISRDCRLLAAVQPTRGLDAAACEYLRNQLIAERDKGKAVLIVSLDIDEVMSISDRILVICEGKLAADVKPNTVTLKELGLYMTGSFKQGAA